MIFNLKLEDYTITDVKNAFKLLAGDDDKLISLDKIKSILERNGLSDMEIIFLTVLGWRCKRSSGNAPGVVSTFDIAAMNNINGEWWQSRPFFADQLLRILDCHDSYSIFPATDKVAWDLAIHCSSTKYITPSLLHNARLSHP